MNNLSPQIQLDVFKCFNFNQLFSFQKISRYFNKFINDYEKELTRAYFKIKIVHELAKKHHFKNAYFDLKEADIELGSYEFPLNDQLKKKWQLAVDERIPLYLSFSQSCEGIISLFKVCPSSFRENWFNGYLFLNLPHSPKNIKEMCIIRCWLERLSRCAYKDAEFENIIFNPTLIKLLFEHEKNPSLQFYTKETTLHYCIANFELQAIKFVKDHLKISKKISIDFSLCNNNLEQCNGVILKILNEGVKLPHVCIISKSIVELIKNKIITSTNCSNIVPRIEFEVDGWARFWNFNYLHRRDGVTTKEFIYYGTHYYSSSYEIANINDPNVVFLINYEGTTNIYRNLAFTIQRK